MKRPCADLGCHQLNMRDTFLKVIEFCATTKPQYGRTHAVSNFKSLQSRILALESYPQVKVTWFEKTVMTIAIIGSAAWSVAEARHSVVPVNENGAMMCIQMEHEMVLQKILQVESVQNKCE